MTHTGGKDSDLVISDGSSTLTTVDHETLETINSVQVKQIASCKCILLKLTTPMGSKDLLWSDTLLLPS